LKSQYLCFDLLLEYCNIKKKIMMAYFFYEIISLPIIFKKKLQSHLKSQFILFFDLLLEYYNIQKKNNCIKSFYEIIFTPVSFWKETLISSQCQNIYMF